MAKPKEFMEFMRTPDITSAIIRRRPWFLTLESRPVLAGSANGDSESAFAYGALGGIKFFVTERASLNLGVNWVHTKISDTDIDTFTGTVGLSFYFGK